ncbi:MAG: DNA adenine methylase [Potamolinea sp.]
MSNIVQQNKSVLPFLKWVGGKSRLLQQYQNYLPKISDIKTYYEPFLGGGSVFFHLQPNLAVLSDINQDLIETYCSVRDNLEELMNLLQIHQNNHNNDYSKNHEYYYQVRSRIYNTPIERAARLIYLNRTCFNGLYRVNSKGEFNVPVGKYKNPKICNPDLLYSASAALKSAKIEVRNFEEILDHAKTSDDFVYFDPPYHPLNNTSYFTAYSADSFNKDNQIRLRNIFAELANRGVKVMLSNSDCKFIRELYSEFNIHEILASRVINSNAQKRGKISEVLVTSY